MDQPNESERLCDEESIWIHAAQEGDRGAFTRLVERYWDSLYRWLYRLTHDRHAAEDLAQESFLKTFASLQTFRAGSNFRAWLFRIGYNSFINQRRKLGRARQPLPEQTPDREEGPEGQALSREALQLLARAVNRLPTEFRAAFLLRAEHELSFRDIGATLNITEETARWRVFKARQKLMNILAPQLDRE